MKFDVYDRTNGMTIATGCKTLTDAIKQAAFARKTDSTCKIEIWSGKPEYAIYDERGNKIGNQR